MGWSGAWAEARMTEVVVRADLLPLAEGLQGDGGACGMTIGIARANERAGVGEQEDAEQELLFTYGVYVAYQMAVRNIPGCTIFTSLAVTGTAAALGGVVGQRPQCLLQQLHHRRAVVRVLGLERDSRLPPPTRFPCPSVVVLRCSSRPFMRSASLERTSRLSDRREAIARTAVRTTSAKIAKVRKARRRHERRRRHGRHPHAHELS